MDDDGRRWRRMNMDGHGHRMIRTNMNMDKDGGG